MRKLPMFWWKGAPNFGDALSPWLVEKVFGVPTQWCAPQKAGKLIAIGSTFSTIRAGDTVWGTGIYPYVLRERVPKLRKDAKKWSAKGVRFLAVRGPLTRAFVLERGGDCPEVYGDPADLLPFYYTPKHVGNYAIGALRHLSDNEDIAKILPQGSLCIDVRDPWPHVVDAIHSCDRILSSSLHGLIVAEAYGIRAVWVECGLHRAKFNDYYAATGRTNVVPVAWHDAVDALPPALPPRHPCDKHPLLAAARASGF